MLRSLTARLRALRQDKGTGQFFLFLVVGVLNTAFGYGCFALLLWLGLHYGLAALLSTVLGVLFNFRTTGRLVFSSRDNGRLGRFIGVAAVIYATNLLGLRLGLMSGVGPFAMGAVLLLPLAFLSYYLQDRFVYAVGGTERR